MRNQPSGWYSHQWQYQPKPHRMLPRGSGGLVGERAGGLLSVGCNPKAKRSGPTLSFSLLFPKWHSFRGVKPLQEEPPGSGRSAGWDPSQDEDSALIPHITHYFKVDLVVAGTDLDLRRPRKGRPVEEGA